MRNVRNIAVTLAISALLAFALRSAAAPLEWRLLAIPALAIAIACATLGERRGSAGAAFRRGWVFGTAYVIASLAWVIVTASAHLGPTLFVVACVLCAIEALPIAIAAWAFWRARTLGAVEFCLGVPALYALLETARANGPLGLPLATFGVTQTSGPLAVVLAIGGIPLASFVMLVAAATIVFVVRDLREPQMTTVSRRTLGAAVAVAVVALVGSTLVWHASLAARDRRPLARVGIVEAGRIDVGESFATTAKYYADATQKLPNDVDFALWPEGVLFLTAPDATAQRAVARQAAIAFGRPILAGATLRARGALHNDLLEIDPRGNVTSVYTKRRLVPFGEYQPFAIGVKRASYDVATARLETPVRIGNAAPFGALICFEVAFADLTRESANQGAGFIVAGLNDTWFANTDGPAQLAQLSQAHAIESGIAMVRADAVPPSGAIDADGTWIGEPLRADGVTVVEVPRGAGTVFRRIGMAPILALLALFASIGIVRIERNMRAPLPYRGDAAPRR